MTNVRYFLILMSAFCISVPGVGESEDRLHLFAYDPQCVDYTIGYSIGLMAEGRLIGRPSNLCKLEVDTSGCLTNLCKVGLQLKAWKECLNRIADARPRSVCDWQSQEAKAALPPLTGNPPTRIDAIYAPHCFQNAALLLRTHLRILLSPTINPEEQDAALDLNLEALEKLRGSGDDASGIFCGHQMAVEEGFPTLPAVKSLRLMIMAQAALEEDRPVLFALARLAYEENLASRRLPRELWYACFVELEYQYFVGGRETAALLQEPLNYCPTFAAEESMRGNAVLDLREAKK